MDYKYYFRFEVGDAYSIIKPSIGNTPMWGRGLTEAFELEIPDDWNAGLQGVAITHMIFAVARGDNNFTVFQSGLLPVNANYNILIERYIRPTDYLVLILLRANGEVVPSSAIKEIPVRILMRED